MKRDHIHSLHRVPSKSQVLAWVDGHSDATLAGIAAHFGIKVPTLKMLLIRAGYRKRWVHVTAQEVRKMEALG
jgi:hypothetical protein